MATSPSAQSSERVEGHSLFQGFLRIFVVRGSCSRAGAVLKRRVRITVIEGVLVKKVFTNHFCRLHEKPVFRARENRCPRDEQVLRALPHAGDSMACFRVADHFLILLSSFGLPSPDRASRKVQPVDRWEMAGKGQLVIEAPKTFDNAGVADYRQKGPPPGRLTRLDDGNRPLYPLPRQMTLPDRHRARDS